MYNMVIYITKPLRKSCMTFHNSTGIQYYVIFKIKIMQCLFFKERLPAAKSERKKNVKSVYFIELVGRSSPGNKSSQYYLVYTKFVQQLSSLASKLCVQLLTNDTKQSLPYLVRVIWNVLYPAMKEESRVRLCLPEPPTPTASAWPLGVRIIREIFTRWVMAS